MSGNWWSKCIDNHNDQLLFLVLIHLHLKLAFTYGSSVWILTLRHIFIIRKMCFFLFFFFVFFFAVNFPCIGVFLLLLFYNNVSYFVGFLRGLLFYTTVCLTLIFTYPSQCNIFSYVLHVSFFLICFINPWI